METKTQAKALEALSHHPDPEVRELAEFLTAQRKQNHGLLKLVRAALTQLRVDVKYLVFDLEATRRERDELKGY